MSSLLILGGARSGKSRHAMAAQPSRSPVTFIATARAADADMAARIARHRAERPSHWTTVEESLDVPARVAAAHRRGPIVVDCVTVWIANLMERGDTDQAVLGAVDELTGLLPRSLSDVTLVTNEVGEGVHPPTEAGLRFRDLLGIVNQRLAAACDHVVLMVAGLPLTLKTPSAHGTPVQAP